MTAQHSVDRRRKLLVDRSAQGHILRLLTVLVLVAMLAFIGIALFGHGAEPNSVKLLVWLLLATILILIGVVYFGLRFSNKIVGPIYAFGRNLKSVQQGDYTGELHLRHGDEFQNLAGVFNLTVESLRQRINDDIDFCDRLVADLDGLVVQNQQAKDALVRMIKEQRTAKERFVVKS